MNNNYETGLNNPEQNKPTNEQMSELLKNYIEAIEGWKSQNLSEENNSASWNESMIAKKEFKKLYSTLSPEEQNKLDEYLKDKYSADDLFFIKRDEIWENESTV